MSATRRDLLHLRFATGDEARAVRIDTTRCLAWNRSFCTTCVERCPVPGAIRLIAQMPQVNPSRCDGCGMCVDRCPAPEPAIVSP